MCAQKFYPDDPIREMPPPIDVEDARYRKLNDYYDLFTNLFADPGDEQPEPKDLENGEQPIPAQAVNTLGEVPDDPAWFINRIGTREMSLEDIRRGPGDSRPPNAVGGPWVIRAGKNEGVTPGFRIKDSTGENYLIKFDPKRQPEMATGADVIGSALFHALGYNVPENHLVEFYPEQLAIGEDVTIRDASGERKMTRADVNAALRKVPRMSDGKIRAVASRFLPGKILGEFRYWGTRADDPNDYIPHEHRRDLRGLHVFFAWLNHSDSRAINTLDSLVEENGRKFVQHYLIDFGAILGSASVVSNSARDGNAYFFQWKPMWGQIGSLGLFVPRWARASYIQHPALGMIEYPSFRPESWKPNYPATALVNRLPDDEFWAAKKVMAFTDEQIREAVKLANYTPTPKRKVQSPEKLIGDYLINRRDIIGRTYFAKVLPLDEFRIEDGTLRFTDLERKYGFVESRRYNVSWSIFDNEKETHQPIPSATTFELPTQTAQPGYYAAKIVADDEAKTVTVYIRRSSNRLEIVGIDRTW